MGKSYLVDVWHVARSVIFENRGGDSCVIWLYVLGVLWSDKWGFLAYFVMATAATVIYMYIVYNCINCGRGVLVRVRGGLHHAHHCWNTSTGFRSPIAYTRQPIFYKHRFYMGQTALRPQVDPCAPPQSLAYYSCLTYKSLYSTAPPYLHASSLVQSYITHTSMNSANAHRFITPFSSV